MGRFDVSTHRRFKEGLRWENDRAPPPDYWKIAQYVLEVLICVVAVMALYAWMQTSDLEDRLSTQKALTHKYSGLLSDCMNGGAVFDKTTSTAYFCGRVIGVKLK